MHQFWQALRRVEPVFQTFRARFRGKCSPVHFFWGAFDLAVSRFNGRRAPLRKAKVDRDAYDEEVISLGFWPGDPWTGATEAMFYAYTVPEPAGLAGQRVRPDAAFFSAEMKEFVLPYDDVAARPTRRARSSSSRRAPTTREPRSPAGTARRSRIRESGPAAARSRAARFLGHPSPHDRGLSPIAPDSTSISTTSKSNPPANVMRSPFDAMVDSIGAPFTCVPLVLPRSDTSSPWA